MKEVTNVLKKAVSSYANWRFTIFHRVLNALNNNSIKTSFWEGEENWASILIDQKVVGYVWAKGSLIVLERRKGSLVKELLEDFDNIGYILVESLSGDLFRLDDDSLKVHFNNFPLTNPFTMEDLWFSSNSI